MGRALIDSYASLFGLIVSCRQRSSTAKKSRHAVNPALTCQVLHADKMGDILIVEVASMKIRSFVLLLTVALFAMLPIYANDGTPTNCKDVAGVLMTDIYAITPGNIDLGPAFGDLGGAVSAQILGQNPDGSYNVQHYWVSSQGDVIKFKQAVLYPVYPIPGNTAVVSVPWGNYIAYIIPGGTGKWANATGWITNSGMADFNELTVVMRYRGNVCFNAQTPPPTK
jgi:hypothetical protein